MAPAQSPGLSAWGAPRLYLTIPGGEGHFEEEDPVSGTPAPGRRGQVDRLNRALNRMAHKLAQSEQARQQAEVELRRRSGDPATLSVITAVFNASFEIPDILDRLRNGLSANFGVPGGAIFLWDDSGSWLLPALAWGLADVPAGGLKPFAPAGFPYNRVIESRQAVLVEDLRSGTYYPAREIAATHPGWTCYLSQPLTNKGSVVGVLDLFGHRVDDFTAEEIERYAVIGQQVGAKIQNARLYQQIRTGRERSRTLSQQIMEAQEAERRHISRELHDQIGGSLTALKVNLQSAARLLEDDAARALLDDSIAIVDRTLQQVRTLSLDLRPSLLDDLGIAAAIRWYVDRQAQVAGFTARVTADPPDIQLDPELATTCFRVVQEAITNVVRHAQARHVWIHLKQAEEQVELTIRDDGVGFDVSAARERGANDTSLGLLGMRERVQYVGGRITISSDSETGTGTLIRAIFATGEPGEAAP